MIVYVYVHNDVYVFACRCTSILDYISRLVLVDVTSVYQGLLRMMGHDDISLVTSGRPARVEGSSQRS
jgi:hypothetical protein